MKIAVVGSRKYNRLSLVQSFVRRLPLDVTIISGGAPGVDYEAEKTAKKMGMKTLILIPDWKNLNHPQAYVKTNQFGEKYDALAGKRRNKQIVDEADLVVAFWDGMSSGTNDTLDHANRVLKDTYIIMPDSPLEPVLKEVLKKYEQRKRQGANGEVPVRKLGQEQTQQNS